MAESTRLVDLVQAGIDDFLSSQRAVADAISPDTAPFLRFASELLSGGKRFRALFCYWGWQATGDGDGFDAVIAAASALEFFHAAALVHDDIIDNSDTRRGMPAAHRRFQELHQASSWRGDGAEYGRSSAILLGDLLLGWSDELLDSGLRMLDVSRATDARRQFNRMRTDVTFGQYLDLLEEKSWHVRDEAELLQRAHTVITYKSAKYSVEAPLLIGASIGAADPAQLSALQEFGLPLGVAYQLRDDVLGVFGDPAVTGKPSGDDLREGKRTVLIAVARTRLPATARRLLDELLGDPELSAHQVMSLQASIRDSGALDEVERLIQQNVEQAKAALEGARITAEARDQLLRLADSVSRRSA